MAVRGVSRCYDKNNPKTLVGYCREISETELASQLEMGSESEVRGNIEPTKTDNLNYEDKILMIWFSIISVVGIGWGVVFAFFGLGVLPPFNTDVLVPWGNGVYGATLIGFCATLLFVGRYAFRRNDPNLMKLLLCGTYVWLIIEALFSLYYQVFLNVIVDVGIAVLFSVFLLKGIRNATR